jgi:hypothetical protein
MNLIIIFLDLLLSIMGYQNSIDRFQSVRIACSSKKEKSFVKIDADILSSSQYINRLKIDLNDSILKFNFKRRLVIPQYRTFLDIIIIKTYNQTILKPIPTLSGKWADIEISLNTLVKGNRRVIIENSDAIRDMGECNFD